MQNVWVLASLWVGLALVATLLAIWFRISTALTEIVVGTVAQLIFGAFIVQGGLAAKSDWISFLAGTGAIVLTFLAGAELDPAIFRTKWKESTVIGLVGFFGPFLGCTAVSVVAGGWTLIRSLRAHSAVQVDRRDRESWRMPPLNMLSKPVMSTGRKIGLTVLRSYLAIAMILVIVRIVELAVAR